MHFSIDSCKLGMSIQILVFCFNSVFFIYNLVEKDERARHVSQDACSSLPHNNTEQQNTVSIVSQIDLACLRELIIVETRNQINPIYFSVDFFSVSKLIFVFVGIHGNTVIKNAHVFFSCILSSIEQNARHVARKMLVFTTQNRNNKRPCLLSIELIQRASES